MSDRLFLFKGSQWGYSVFGALKSCLAFLVDFSVLSLSRKLCLIYFDCSSNWLPCLQLVGASCHQSPKVLLLGWWSLKQRSGFAVSASDPLTGISLLDSPHPELHSSFSLTLNYSFEIVSFCFLISFDPVPFAFLT